MRALAFILFFILIILGLLSNYTSSNAKVKSFLYWCGGVVLIVFAGFREIGIDHDSAGYLNYYESGKAMWLLAEPTFGIISEFVRYFFNDFRYVLIIYAIIGVVLKLKGIRQLTDLVWLSIIVYFSTYFLLHDFTQIRASVASGLFLLAIVPIAERRFWTFFGITIIAFLFHYSAIILLPLYFLSNNHISAKGKLLLWLAIPAGIVLHYLHFNPVLMIPIETVKMKIEIYRVMQQNAEISLNVFNLVYIVKYLILFVMILFYETLYTKSKYVSLLIKIYALSLFSYLALSSNTIFAMRISELLGIVEIIIIPYLYYLIKPKFAGAALVVLIAFIYLIINIYSLELIYSSVNL